MNRVPTISDGTPSEEARAQAIIQARLLRKSKMTEGWYGDNYVILFDPSDRTELRRRYEVDQHLTDCQLIGLLGWDDFIIERATGERFTVPTVPLDPIYLKPMQFAIDPTQLHPDHRFTGRIKWYLTPLVFGGDASATDNIQWLTLDQHVEAVTWWNRQHTSIKRS